MSLKYFHLFLITLATLLTLGFAAWCFKMQSEPDPLPTFWVGVFSAVIGVALPIYAIWFLRKTKRLIL